MLILISKPGITQRRDCLKIANKSTDCSYLYLCCIGFSIGIFLCYETSGRKAKKTTKQQEQQQKPQPGLGYETKISIC